MFTGIIEEVGRVKALSKGPKSLRLTVQAHTVLEDTNLGDSIATNGVCLTVTDQSKDTFSVDVMYETLNRSTLKALSMGSVVNLERALTLHTRLGGHMMSGHVDGVGTIKKIEKEDIATKMTIHVPKDLTKYMIEKGSIGVDGISLTLVHVHEDRFVISLIPHTSMQTTLWQKRVGDEVNIEVDLIGKYVEKLLGTKKSSNLTEEVLKNYGY